MRFQPKTKEELQQAIIEYCDNSELGIKRYGRIEDWDTYYITDMSFLFNNFRNFNEPIGVMRSMTYEVEIGTHQM